ncbi:MAG: RusA family crossover junction endodeoxyribonuclease [Pirellulales bacterium]|nr:RusA family crossover junction endodeoxyribonuclease [Pirellulales bacterium]
MKLKKLAKYAKCGAMELDPYQSEITIPGEPVPQSRPRVTRNGGVYYHRRIVLYRNSVAQAARAAGVPLRTGVLSLALEFVFTRPKNHRLKSGALSKNATPRPTRCDVDNLAKGIFDALEGCAFNNDSQVAELFVRKRWADENETAFTSVVICEIEPPPDVISKRTKTISNAWNKTQRDERNVHLRTPVTFRAMVELEDENEDYGESFSSD